MTYSCRPILIIDAAQSIDEAVLQTLSLRGYNVTTTETAGEALKRIHEADFECVVIDIATSTGTDYIESAEIRQFIRTSAVALMTRVPIESLIRESLEEGSIEPLTLPVLIARVHHLSRPAFLVGLRFDPELVESIRSRGMLFSCGTSLRFAMNLLVDGWCHIVFLTADITRVVRYDEIALFHRVNAKHLAILAFASPGTSAGIICAERPQEADEYIALFEQAVKSRPPSA